MDKNNKKTKRERIKVSKPKSSPIISSSNPNDILTKHDWDKLYKDEIKRQVIQKLKDEVTKDIK